MLSLPGYNIEFKNRPTKKGGGVLLYVNDSLSYAVREDLSTSSEFFESMFIEIETKNMKNIIIATIYRAPGLNVTEFVKEFKKLIYRKQDFLFAWRL